MRRIENDCCGCATPGYPCLGNACPLRSVEYVDCDKCEEDISNEFFKYDNKELCTDCLLEVLVADKIIEEGD